MTCSNPVLHNLFKVILSLAFIFVGCAEIDEPSTGGERTDAPDQEIWGGKIEITQDGKLQSIVRAGYIQLFEKKQITLFDSGVVVDFYNKQGQHTSVLTSERARIDERIDLFLALGNVVVVSDSGETLRTERLYWDKEKKKIRSDTLAVLTTAVDSVLGYNFEADENLSSWTLENPTGQTMRKQE